MLIGSRPQSRRYADFQKVSLTNEGWRFGQHRADSAGAHWKAA